MKLLVDNQLPSALARFITASGIESSHVLDLQLDAATDREIWAYAKAHGFTMVSKDEDFFHLATLDADGPALVWVRLGNCRKVALLEVFEATLPKMIEMLRTGQKIIEVRQAI